ncbi:MAG TPA: oxygenase MpaB family protein [Novosphingobium sp.]|nr:oxygenase MpaB family protein [Novosphingobium sp.]
MQQMVKDLIVDRVRGFFNDRSRGERPVERRDDGLFGPGSVAWKVHGDVTTMMVGGVAALLMQMLHPAVLAGVWDHSNFRTDMHGRLRRTARFIALTTYGSRKEAEQAIERVREVHRHVKGTLANGRPYSAEDPDLLAWVHITETYCFLEAWKRYAEPAMPLAEQDLYFSEMRELAMRLGAHDVPAARQATVACLRARRAELEVSGRTREIVRLLLNPPVQNTAVMPLQSMTAQAAIDLLPPWARRMHGLHSSKLSRPMVYGGTAGLAGLLRWAFR